MPQRIAELPGDPGTYLLWFHVETPLEIVVGRLGKRALPRGWYGYVGSAFGPGGLRARVGRHLRGSPRVRWHVDRLRARVAVSEVWYVTGMAHEHAWAGCLATLSGSRVIPGFGASDCACMGHLVHFARRPSTRCLGGAVPQRLRTENSAAVELTGTRNSTAI